MSTRLELNVACAMSWIHRSFIQTSKQLAEKPLHCIEISLLRECGNTKVKLFVKRGFFQAISRLDSESNYIANSPPSKPFSHPCYFRVLAYWWDLNGWNLIYNSCYVLMISDELFACVNVYRATVQLWHCMKWNNV